MRSMHRHLYFSSTDSFAETLPDNVDSFYLVSLLLWPSEERKNFSLSFFTRSDEDEKGSYL